MSKLCHYEATVTQQHFCCTTWLHVRLGQQGAPQRDWAGLPVCPVPASPQHGLCTSGSVVAAESALWFFQCLGNQFLHVPLEAPAPSGTFSSIPLVLPHVPPELAYSSPAERCLLRGLSSRSERPSFQPLPFLPSAPGEVSASCNCSLHGTLRARFTLPVSWLIAL